jgi:hypothetical protein
MISFKINLFQVQQIDNYYQILDQTCAFVFTKSLFAGLRGFPLCAHHTDRGFILAFQCLKLSLCLIYQIEKHGIKL